MVKDDALPALVTVAISVLILSAAWIDPLVFGGTWRNYLAGSIIEAGMFLSGFIAYWTMIQITGMRRRRRSREG